VRRNSGTLAECLMAWARGENGTDAQAGALRLSEFINLICDALKKKK